jgi:probable HAF family extracellular repeat protein
MNDWDQVAGALSVGGTHHAAIWQIKGGNPVDLGTLPAPYNVSSAATAISDLAVVGYSASASGAHAFLWEGNLFTGKGVMTDLGTLPAPYNVTCIPAALNIWGQVVGNCGTEAFLWARNPLTGKGK